MMNNIKVGFEFKLKGEKCKMLSFIDSDKDLYKYYFKNGKVYVMISGETNQNPISKEYGNQPFYWNNKSIYCFINRGGRRTETSFDFLYEHEMFDDDGNIFIKITDSPIKKENISYKNSNKEVVPSPINNNFNMKAESKTNLIDQIMVRLGYNSSKQTQNNVPNKTISNNIFDNYFYNDSNAIKIIEGMSNIDFGYLRFRNQYNKCMTCNTNPDNCESWRIYNNDCSNRIYWRKYHDDYCAANYSFLMELLHNSKYSAKFANKTTITIVLVGCGNFYELEAINEILKSYNKKIDVIVLDEGIWSYNSFDLIRNNLKINNLWFKRCDFNLELKNKIYKEADIIYYSRCLIHYREEVRDFIFPKLAKIINNNQLTIFSQVVNVNEEEPIKFEKELRSFLLSNCKVIGGHFTNKYNSYVLKDIIIKDEKLQTKIKAPLSYYMYVIEGRKQLWLYQ